MWQRLLGFALLAGSVAAWELAGPRIGCHSELGGPGWLFGVIGAALLAGTYLAGNAGRWKRCPPARRWSDGLFALGVTLGIVAGILSWFLLIGTWWVLVWFAPVLHAVLCVASAYGAHRHLRRPFWGPLLVGLSVGIHTQFVALVGLSVAGENHLCLT